MRFQPQPYLTTIAVGLLSLWVGSALADTPTVPFKDPIIINLPPKDLRNLEGRPKAPSRQSVTCIYDDGNLYLEFAIPEGECQLMLSDSSTGEMVVEYFDSAVSEPVYVGYHRTASLTVNTENGNTYAGEW